MKRLKKRKISSILNTQEAEVEGPTLMQEDLEEVGLIVVAEMEEEEAVFLTMVEDIRAIHLINGEEYRTGGNLVATEMQTMKTLKTNHSKLVTTMKISLMTKDTVTEEAMEIIVVDGGGAMVVGEGVVEDVLVAEGTDVLATHIMQIIKRMEKAQKVEKKEKIKQKKVAMALIYHTAEEATDAVEDMAVAEAAVSIEEEADMWRVCLLRSLGCVQRRTEGMTLQNQLLSRSLLLIQITDKQCIQSFGKSTVFKMSSFDIQFVHLVLFWLKHVKKGKSNHNETANPDLEKLTTI
mmetsp:Transcript_26440/g.39100  ORF Transcript_26440/g.39100 Transcript_26440/m.39100 type:complete len:293 (+) Transcript_26440:801-1679(+)